MAKKSTSDTPAPIVRKMPRRHNKSNGHANIPNGVARSEPKFAHIVHPESGRIVPGYIIKRKDNNVVLAHNPTGKGWKVLAG